MFLIRTLLLLVVGIPLLLTAAEYEYTLHLLHPNTHTFAIELEVESGKGDYVDFQMATWRPGRYFLQDYAAGVSHFSAMGPEGDVLDWQKVNPSVWRVYANGGRIRVSYRYFAHNQDAGSSYYADDEIYFNPVNCFLYIKDRMDGEVKLDIPQLPADWKVATALYPGEAPGEFRASDWHEFADSPTVFAPRMKQLQFETDGVKFYLHFQGDYKGDPQTDAAALATVEKICREQAAVFGGFPFEEYHFIYRLLPFEMRHAVEHSRSSSYALPAHVTTSAEKIISGIGGITSHEFWHAWNVKRIRPAALLPYDYSQPQYSSLHWLTEGVTDYYTHLMLVRAGVQDQDYLCRQLSRTIQSLENSYASTVVSPSQSSYDSWLVTSSYAHPHHRISYYTLGSRLGMLIDLTLRSQTEGEKSLDHVFGYFYEHYYQKGKGIPEDGVQTALEFLSNHSWEDFFQKYVHGTQSPDYESLLSQFGLDIQISTHADPGINRLGFLNLEALNNGMRVRRLHPGGDAYLAGMAEGDLIVAMDKETASLADMKVRINELSEGDSLIFTVRRGSLPSREITVFYRGLNSPRSFKISPQKRLKAKQQTLLDGWLGSGQ